MVLYFSKEIGISDLRKQIEDLMQNPVAEGKTITGKKRTSLKLLIPDMMFGEHVEMGEYI